MTKVGIKRHIRGLLNSRKFVAFFEIYSVFNSEKKIVRKFTTFWIFDIHDNVLVSVASLCLWKNLRRKNTKKLGIIRTLLRKTRTGAKQRRIAGQPGNIPTSHRWRYHPATKRRNHMSPLAFMSRFGTFSKSAARFWFSPFFTQCPYILNAPASMNLRMILTL